MCKKTERKAPQADIPHDVPSLVTVYARRFQRFVYEDAESGLSVTYHIFLPKNYSVTKQYPTVVFIADASCVGSLTDSLTQGLGALVWASDEWQSRHETIVAVPVYDTIVLDDHRGYTKTAYVALTKRLVEHLSERYAVDTDRIYGTGQSMGCMIHLILAAEHPDLYAACMLVDGQWDANELRCVEGQRFVYFAAEDDERAFTGMRALMRQFDADSAAYTFRRWDGGASPAGLSEAAAALFSCGTDANFISWKTGTVRLGDGKKRNAHMASFDYAYRCTDVMEWLFR